MIADILWSEVLHSYRLTVIVRIESYNLELLVQLFWSSNDL